MEHHPCASVNKIGPHVVYALSRLGRRGSLRDDIGCLHGLPLLLLGLVYDVAVFSPRCFHPPHRPDRPREDALLVYLVLPEEHKVPSRVDVGAFDTQIHNGPPHGP